MASSRSKKPVSKLLPITRTIRLLRSQGWVADAAETRRGKHAFDWGGFADVVAWRPDQGWLLVQCTGWRDVGRRRHKINASGNARLMINSGARVEVWGWDRYREHHRCEQILPQHLTCPVLSLRFL